MKHWKNRRLVLIVMIQNEVVCIEGNGSRPSHRGTGWSIGGSMFTLNSTEVHAVCYGICSTGSNAMLSDNPKSGFYEATTSSTLDNNGGNPSCNQGGVLIVEVRTNDNNRKKLLQENSSKET